MEKWEEAVDRNWINTVKHFVKEYNVVTRVAEQAEQHDRFDLASALREHNISSIPLENAPPPAALGLSMEE